MIYKVLVLSQADGSYLAQALFSADLKAKGATKTEALQNLRLEILTLQLQGQIVEIDVPSAEEIAGDPWMSIVGIAKADPQREFYLKAIANYRKEVFEAEQKEWKEEDSQKMVA